MFLKEMNAFAQSTLLSGMDNTAPDVLQEWISIWTLESVMFVHKALLEA